MNRINIQSISLPRKHDQYHLNSEQTLLVVELLVRNKIVEDFDQISKKVHVDSVRKPIYKCFNFLDSNACCLFHLLC